MEFNIDASWTLFLDRDGVINKRKMGGYIESPEQFEFLPHVLEAISFLSTLFPRIFVVTNQQGIGKGIMTERNLLDIHSYMLEAIEKEGGHISKCYFAPELKSEAIHYRKPFSGMALLAKGDFPEVDFHKSIMIGDTDTDIQFGKRLGMKTILVRSDETTQEKADFEINGLIELKERWKKMY